MQNSNASEATKKGFNFKSFLASAKLALQRIRFHSKEIIASLLLGFLFAKVDKAQQFFSSFASAIEGQSVEAWAFFFVFVGNGLAVVWLSYVFWHKPKKMRPKWVKRILGYQDEDALNIYVKYYKKPEALWWLAVVSSMPVLLSSLTLSVALLRGNDLMRRNGESFSLFENYIGTTYIVVTLIYFVFTILAKPKKTENRSNAYYRKKCLTYGLMFVGLTMVYALIFMCYNSFKLNEFLFLEFSVLAIFVFIPAILASRFWYMASESLRKATTDEKGERIETGEDCERAEKINERTRLASYIVSILFFILTAFYAVTSSLWFSSFFFPIAILLFVFIFYFQLADFLVYNMTKKRFWLAMGVLAFLTLFIPRRSHYEMKFNEANGVTYMDRVDLEEYYLRWLKDKMENEKADTTPTFYLVAAEGGGSRSGAWTSSVLTQLDKKSKGEFRKKCFAISTVSGGTVGAGVTLSLWDAANENGVKGNELYEPEIMDDSLSVEQKYIHGIFRRNYVSSAIIGLFFHDFIQSIPVLNAMYVKKYSRSDKHQEEECDAIYRGLKMVSENNPNFNMDGEKYKGYYKSDFLGLYYDENKKVKASLPLFFPNTARVNDGRRGVLSPVKNSVETVTKTEGDYDTTHLFVAAIDLIGLVGKEDPKKSMRLSGAVSLSQLFPYVNSTIRVSEKSGRFMDGGAYENMGLTTIGEVFRKLCSVNQSPDTNLIKRIYPNKDLEEVKKYLRGCNFKLILIYNSKIEMRSELDDASVGLQLLDPLAGLLATPFTGHTEHMYWQSVQDFSNGCSPYVVGDSTSNNRIIKFPLIKNPDKKEVVMSRWLSEPEMDTVFVRAERQVERLMKEVMGE